MIRGDEATFDDFYIAHYDRLVDELSVVCDSRAEAEDLVQEAFARCWSRWNAIGTYDLPVAWVRRVALNLSTSRYRKLRTLRVRAGPPERASVEDRSESTDQTVTVRTALSRLPRRDRQILVMRYLGDLSVEAIADELGIPIGTVKSRLSRAREALLKKGGLTYDRT